MAAVALVAAATALILLVTQPWDTAAPAPDGIQVDPARVAELEAAEAERNVENLTAAAELAVSAQERLLPVMDGLYAALPAGDEPGDASAADASTGEPEGERKPPTAAELGQWRDIVADVTADVEALPSGSSEHNIVRNGLVLSTELLGDTLDVLELAGESGGSGASERLFAVAGDLRTRAVDAWAVGAVQLDLQYIAADRGHLHAFLPLHSGMSEEGEAEVPHGDH